MQKDPKRSFTSRSGTLLKCSSRNQQFGFETLFLMLENRKQIGWWWKRVKSVKFRLLSESADLCRRVDEFSFRWCKAQNEAKRLKHSSLIGKEQERRTSSVQTLVQMTRTVSKHSDCITMTPKIQSRVPCFFCRGRNGHGWRPTRVKSRDVDNTGGQ